MNKKYIIITIIALFTAFGTYTAVAPKYSIVNAQVKNININLGQEAIDAELPGTADFDPDDGEVGFNSLLSRFLSIVMTIGALMVFFYLIWGGIQWITAGGDKSKIESARNKITQSIIGILVLASVVAIMVFIQGFLGVEVIDFTGKRIDSKPRETSRR